MADPGPSKTSMKQTLPRILILISIMITITLTLKKRRVFAQSPEPEAHVKNTQLEKN